MYYHSTGKPISKPVAPIQDTGVVHGKTEVARVCRAHGIGCVPYATARVENSRSIIARSKPPPPSREPFRNRFSTSKGELAHAPRLSTEQRVPSEMLEIARKWWLRVSRQRHDDWAKVHDFTRRISTGERWPSGLFGPSNYMWASDFPHTDSTWPYSRQIVERDFAGVPKEVTRKIVFEIAASLYEIG
jgi:hypothetical protein